jgi:nucleoside-diphosphate-sugar epimerase
MSKERVLLTGASGHMGWQAFLELLRRLDRYNVRLLLRPSRVNRTKFAQYADQPGVEIIWGDLTSAADVLRAVTGVDAILHPAALISPAADHNPQMARRVNAGGMHNLIEAVRKQPNGPEEIRVVNVGSVAQYGDRLPPREWIRAGDPLMPSVFDYYALTKCEAERSLIESGITHWASMRQTYIAIPDALSLMDPILFHQPIDQRIELITDRDAGFGLVQCLDVPSDFWRRIYNMAGGPKCRVRFLDYMDHMLGNIFGGGDYRKIYERNWFATRNFHCGYYQDSHELNKYTGHFRDTLEDHYSQVEKAVPSWMKLGSKITPSPVTKAILRRMAEPLQWIRENNTERIEAFFGSREAWEKIPGWGHGEEVTSPPSEPPPPRNPNALQDLEGYAKSRGGSCLSTGSGDPATLLDWRCGRDHEFQASPNLLISGGYWCPTCAPNVDDTSGWNFDTAAQYDPGLAGIYYKKP